MNNLKELKPSVPIQHVIASGVRSTKRGNPGATHEGKCILSGWLTVTTMTKIIYITHLVI